MSDRPGKETLVSVDELLNYLHRREDFSQQELALLEDVCVFAQQHYAHITHPTGNPYLSYACGIAKILASNGAKAPIIAAALLYPPPPIAGTVVDECRKQFQNKPDLLNLIDELFHLDQLEWDIWAVEQDRDESRVSKERRKIIRKMHLLTTDEVIGSDEAEVYSDALAAHFQKREKQITNLIDMFFVAVSDFRPLMIKLVDHLLLMRLLKDTDPALKEVLHYSQLAKITLAVYAPIADRLSMWRLKSELEDMAFRLLNPDLYKEIGKQLEASKQQRELAIIREIIPTIENLLHEFGIEAFISGRAKHIYGVYQKMEVRQLALEQINDLLGIRILVATIEQCYEVQNIIHAFWEPRTDFYDGQAGRDWIVNPKENMYQSLHTTIMMSEKIVEVQIRTYAMHEIAEYGVTSATYAAHWRYKESKAYRKGKLPREVTLKDRNKQIIELQLIKRQEALDQQQDDNDEDEATSADVVGQVTPEQQQDQKVASARRIEIEHMTLDMSALFLLRRAGILTEHDSLEKVPQSLRDLAQTIVREVDGLPLALEQAGAYIKETGCGLDGYLKRYRSQRAILLNRPTTPDPNYNTTVATTWNLSFQKVEAANRAAADLLRLCAFLAPDAIPEEIITEGASKLDLNISDLQKLEAAIQELRKYSLIKRNSTEHTLNMHPLVQVVLLDQIPERQQRTWAERATRAVNAAFPKADFANWPQCERLLLQAQTCAALIKQHNVAWKEAAHLLGKVARYLQQQGQSREDAPLPDHKDLLPMQKEPLKDRIFVITPKGHVLDFPAGATPLDFAYRIHSELGNNYSGAKVDDHIVRLDYKLRNGQIVELITSRKGRGPSPDWLTINKDEEGHSTYVFVRTRQARQKILSGLNKIQSEFNNKK